ncbi:MAG: DNA polymerase I [Planctomycetales bacterium]|nr:DNA polymerase I [Planctomycetales bacterium]
MFAGFEDDVEAAADAKPAATASAAASPVHERRATFDVADPSSGDLPSETNGGDVTGVDRASVDRAHVDEVEGAATTNVTETDDDLEAHDGVSGAAGNLPRAVPLATPDSLAGQTVYVVDAHSLIYQVFHALPEMTGPAGQPVGAIHGFIRDIVYLLDQKRPDFLFCAFDYGETFRHKIYEAYKSNRSAMPDDLRPQIPNIQRMLAALGVPALFIENYEADDILATIAWQTDQAGGQCFLVTGDKDCRQLITDRVRVYNIRKNEAMDAAKLEAEWGVRPDQVVDLQALWGDSTDNVPGVPGIGAKTATELLKQYGTLDAILDHAHEVKAKQRRENLIKYREQALISRKLVKLDTHVPIAIDWDAGRVGGVRQEELAELCQEFGFRSLAERLGGLTAREAPASWEADYRTVESLEQLESLVAEMRQAEWLSIDTETTSTNPRFAEIVGYSFAWRTGLSYYVPVRAPAGDPCLDAARTREILRPVLESETPRKLGQNLKYDMIVLRGDGIDLRGVAFDTMVADYLLDPGERNHSVDDLAKRYLNHKTIKIAELIGTGKKQKRMDEVPVASVTDYAAEDADVPLRLHPILQRRIEDEQLGPLFRDLEMPLVEVLADMEYAGIRIDVALLKQMSKRFAERQEQLRAEIYQLAGEEFNIDSPKQLAGLLFDKLGLPVVKKTKTGASTDVEVLEELASQHELPAKIIAYRQTTKLKSTYVDALPTMVHPQTGRVHTSFKQDVAATGRLSSTEPNLQNIPIRTTEGREIRAAFVAGEADWRLLKADYSQIELRILAHFSGDEALRQAFLADEDIHAAVAAQINRVSLEQVTGDMRRQAKAVNFGVIYGQSPFGLAKALGIDKEEAAAFIDAYFARYQGVDEFMTKTLEECRRNGYVGTALGRKRAVHGVRDPSKTGDSRQRNLPERIAINTVIQGSAADLIKQAMIQVQRRLRRDMPQARMLLQIHDELVFEAPAADVSELAAIVAEEMTAVGELRVPLKVDVAAGLNWAECEAVV